MSWHPTSRTRRYAKPTPRREYLSMVAHAKKAKKAEHGAAVCDAFRKVLLILFPNASHVEIARTCNVTVPTVSKAMCGEIYNTDRVEQVLSELAERIEK